MSELSRIGVIAGRDELDLLQLSRLQGTLRRAYANVSHYRRAFDSAGVHPRDLRSLHDIARFPFATKQDLRDHYPFGMFAVPLNQIARVHASSGTTGKSTAVSYTRRDIETWAICDEVAPPSDMERTIRNLDADLIQRGRLGYSANRRSLRIGAEPLELFRSYFASYVRDQAYCLFGAELTENSEQHWNAQKRAP